MWRGRGQTAVGAKPVAGGCRRAGSRGTARMLPGHLAPLDPRKTRAITSIYAPRKPKPRQNKTAPTRMLDELPIKQTISPFHPLPAIGQKVAEKRPKVYVFNLKDDNRPVNRVKLTKLTEVLKPLTPLRVNTYRKNSLDPVPENKEDKEDQAPQVQPLLRENTYDVIESVYFNAAKINESERTKKDESCTESNSSDVKNKSPISRFKAAAKQVAKLTSMPETGKLLSLRERETFNICKNDESWRLQDLPPSPPQNLTKLSEIFQYLDTKGRCRVRDRDKMKKENSWF